MDSMTDAESLDPLFAEAALYAASRDELSVGGLVGYFDIDETRARALMGDLAEHGLITSTRQTHCGNSAVG